MSPSAPALALAGAALLASARAFNPIIPDVGQADPHIHWWPEAGAYFLYSTHDFSNANTGFRMDDWWTFSSPDLVLWSPPTFLYPNATPANPGNYQSCWATDGAHAVVGGREQYFFYLSIGQCDVAVMQGDSPVGPWRNVLGAPLLNSTFGNSLNPKACFRDPAVFKDDDGSQYLISGVLQVRKHARPTRPPARPPLTLDNPSWALGNLSRPSTATTTSCGSTRT